MSDGSSNPGPRIAVAALAIFALLAIVWTTFTHRIAPKPAEAALPSVSGGGVTLVSDRIVLPDETAALPDSASGLTAHCTACHSTELITTQPVLNAEKWQATIDKMRGTYKAPLDPAGDAALIAELMALPTQQPAQKPAG